MVKKIGVILGLILAVIILYGFSQQIINSLQAGKRLEIAQQELVQAKIKNEQLKKTLQDVKKISYIEYIARDKLNMARPNETVFIIPDKVLDQALAPKEKKAEEKVPNYQGWIRLFFP